MSILRGTPQKYAIDTLLVGKDSYLFLQNNLRVERGGKPLDEELKIKLWNRAYKEGEEVRITKDSFGKSISEYKRLLDAEKLSYRDDGKKEEGLYL